jgi:hypothetical protein
VKEGRALSEYSVLIAMQDVEQYVLPEYDGKYKGVKGLCE